MLQVLSKTIGDETMDGDEANVPPPIVRLSRVSRRFGDVAALADVSLTVRQGEVLGVIGRSGAGKSTLIRCLNGLERPDSGAVEIEGRNITPLDERALQPVRRRIGVIFQHFNLLSAKTVAENVALPLKIEGQSRAARRERTLELLDLVGLADKASAYPAQLSGGQKQRVGIARALSARPALLLSDEATSALDPETTVAILDLLKDINRRFGLTILLITHEMEVIRAIADRVVVLDKGRVVEEGPVWQIFANPQAETTVSLLQSIRPELPEHLAAILSPYAEGDAVLRITVSGPQATQPLIADLVATFGVAARLLHGGVTHIQGQPVGHLFLALPAASPELARRIVTYLRPRTTSVDVLGYVSRAD